MEYSTPIKKRIGGVSVDENIGATWKSPLKLFSPIVETKTICLHDWWLVRPQGGKGIAVGGSTFRRGGVETSFRSSSIKKRHDNCTLESSDGFIIFISGFINRSFTLENGVSPEVCNIFINGFPFNWEDYAPQSVREEPNDAGNCSRSSNGVHTAPPGSLQGTSILQKHDLLLSTRGLHEEDVVRKVIFSDLLEKLKPILGSSITDDNHDPNSHIADKPNEHRESRKDKRRGPAPNPSRMCTRSMTKRENATGKPKLSTRRKTNVSLAS